MLKQEVPGYQIQKMLCRSGGTCVYRGVRVADSCPVILKLLENEQVNLTQRQRFSFSYEVQKTFNHPHISKTLDLVDLGDSQALILADVGGIDLRQYVAKATIDNESLLAVEWVIKIAIQLADALIVIHHTQVIHKDLHPGNIMVSPETGVAQIIDFGLSSLLSREQPALESPDKLEGVLPYISPEQTGRMNRALDYRTDFYSLGVILYELLSGELPFTGEDALAIVHAHIAKTQEPLHQLREEVPPTLSAIIDKLLYKTAEGRYQSALGLKKDLEKCLLNQVFEGKELAFPLGADDISDRFQVPQKLYGRETEVEVLMDRFYLAARGVPQLLAVAGYSGVGKSALVHEVHKPIAAHNGLFISGKFDQLQHNVPYSALKTALLGWLKRVLVLTEDKLEAKKAALVAVLGSSARVLIDFMPEFKYLLGDLPKLPPLGAVESQNRFHLVFGRLIQFISQRRPLVIFIDDLQWADRGTLNLLPVLMRETENHLFIIVAYRDNEVDKYHPAIKALHQVEEYNPQRQTTFTLGPLPCEQVSQLLMDALHRSAKDVLPLAQLVYKKTVGNPFFINEFLKTLYSENLLNFDLETHCWLWSVENINAKGITDNVVELMLGKMQKLPQRTQKLMQLAACVGSRFDLGMLAVIAQEPMVDVARSLWPALKEGLLLQNGGDWFLGVVGHVKGVQLDEIALTQEGKEDNNQISPLYPQCKFLHDRMLQAAYQSLDEESRVQTHLYVGRLMHRSFTAEQASENIFSIVEQLNLGRMLITDPKERLQLARMNLNAAEKAKSACIWDVARGYSDIGLALLPEMAWTDHYQLKFELASVNAEMRYLCGDFEASDQLFSAMLEYAKGDFDKARIWTSRFMQTTWSCLWEQAIDVGRQALIYLDIDIPLYSDRLVEWIEAEQATFDQLTKTTAIENIVDLPEMSDSNLLIACKVIPSLLFCSFSSSRKLQQKAIALKGLNITLQHGKSDFTASLLAHCAFIKMDQGDFSGACVLAEQALKIIDCYPRCREAANCFAGLGNSVLYLKHPYSEVVDLHQKGYELGLENGEAVRSHSNRICMTMLRSTMGMNLSALNEDAETSLNMGRYLASLPVGALSVSKMSKELSCPSNRGVNVMDDSAFPSGLIEAVNRSVFYNYIDYCRVQLCFFYGDRANALKLSKRVYQRAPNLLKNSAFVDYLLQFGLLLLPRLRNNNLEEKQIEKTQFAFCISELKIFADFCPDNFEHKYLLLLAEKSRYDDNSMEDTGLLYQRAIDSAKVRGFTHYQALSNELFAEYWFSKGFYQVGEIYIQRALAFYQQWGCQVKVNSLIERYPEYLGNGKTSQLSSDSEVFPAKSSSVSIHTQTERRNKNGLDYDSVIKSAQVISSELNLKKLAAKVLGVVVENIGAQVSALVLKGSEGLKVEATIALQSDARNATQTPARLLSETQDLPKNIIQYVLRTNEVLNLSDVKGEKAFEDDPYIMTHTPQSILCVPINYRGENLGALYLENNLSTHAFPVEGLDVTKMLLTQAAISFENARLFEEVHALNLGLEKKVDERTAQLALANERLEETNKELQVTNEELQSFSYSVSHDLRSPLRAIKGFSQILLEDNEEQLDDVGKDVLRRLVGGADKMSDLIDGLLELSWVQSREPRSDSVDLSKLVKQVVAELQQQSQDRKVAITIAEGVVVQGEHGMLTSLMENLLNNAWKYSSKTKQASIEFGVEEKASRCIYFVKDNGIGFKQEYANNLFKAFQRLHSDDQFPGTGIGLATVKRIVTKHGGEVWAEAEVDKGATFYFTLKSKPLETH